MPDRPEVGYRANSALIGHGEPIVRPADYAEPLEAEGELVAVIGRPLRHASRDEARAGVLGWTIGNDVSARAWQRADRTFWRAKNSDTFKPMGPWIVTDADPLAATTTVRVDGAGRGTFRTGDMIFDPLRLHREITPATSRCAPATCCGWARTTASAMVPGDTVEVSIGGLGTLRQPGYRGETMSERPARIHPSRATSRPPTRSGPRSGTRRSSG